MAVLVYVLGRTGTGKSYSMRNFPKDQLAVVNVEGKILPFRGSVEIETTNTDDSLEVEKALKIYSKKYKSIVVDDFQYLMSNEFMRRATERGFDKFTEIAAHAWNIADKVRTLPADVIVYIMCHTDTDNEGVERLKTIGKLLDEKIYLEGMSTIVLKTHVSDGKYCFTTQNNGKDTVKSPADMFPTYAIDNDLYYVDQKIREYYELGATMSSEELAAADESVAHDEIAKQEKKKRGRRSVKSEEQNDGSLFTPNQGLDDGVHAEEKEEKPKRTRRSKKSEVPEEITNAGVTDDGVPQNFDDIDVPEAEEPKRKRRTAKSAEDDSTSDIESNSDSSEAAAPVRRRRRRTV